MNQLNAKGQRHGLWEIYYDGFIYWRGTYDGGVMVGYWESYNCGGKLSWTGSFIKPNDNGNNRIGLWLDYDSNGKINYEEFIF